MTEDRRAKWNQRHAAAPDLGEVALVLRRNPHLLPPQGQVLDLACGRGANALWLAERGLQVRAWDYAETAIARLRDAAAQRALRVDADVRDVLADPPSPSSLDAILVSHFLERQLAPALMAALRPGGRLFYQTFTREGAGEVGPSNPAFRLGANELLALFAPLQLRYYREDGAADDGSGSAGLAMLVGERRA